MTSRLLAPNSGPDWARYDTLVCEALTAFSQDIMYAVQVVESARHISEKQKNALKKGKSNYRG